VTARTLASVVIAVLVLAAGASATGPTAAPAGPATFVEAIVTLKDQADVRGTTGTRSAKLRTVVKKLRAKAESSQRRLRTMLRVWEAQGRAFEVTPYWVFNGFSLSARQEVLEELARQPEVLSVTPNGTLDAPVLPSSVAPPETNIALVNAPALWNVGVRGQGIVVANMDTGVDVTHPDLAAQWRGGTNSWFDPYGQHPTTPTDVSGHGTWTMGVMVGRDSGGSSVGMAPAASWIAVKIFNDGGTATEARIHEGFQWLLDPDRDPETADAPNVVNNSWSYRSFGCTLTFQLDLANLRAAGILPVFAAGNSGPFGSSSTSPANNPDAFAVGATNDSDAVYTYSSRGPSGCGEPTTTFPELVAPGVGIRTTDLFGGFTSPSGTSLAAPHAAGALALLLSAFPNLTVAQQEAALKNSARDLGAAGPDSTFGWGRLDVLAAYGALGPARDFTLSATPASASTSQGGSVEYSVSVTPLNGFTGDVGLSVTGLPAGASASFAPATVAGGSGASQLTVATGASTPAGSYPLTLAGASGSLARTVEVTLVVTAPDFTVTASPASASTSQGGTVAYTVSVAPLEGFAGEVGLAVAGLPAGASATFDPATVVGASGSSTLTVTTAASTPAGAYTLTVSGSSGSLLHAADVTLLVAAPDFTLTATPASRSTVQGGSVAYGVSVAPLEGFDGDVALGVSGLPAGASASFVPVSITGAGSSQLTVATAASTPAGSYQLTVTGTSGLLSHSAAVTLVVSPASTTVSPKSTTIATGTLRGGNAASLAADDLLFFEVNASGILTKVTAWYASFTVPNSASSIRVTYKGRNSATCTQALAAWNWNAGAWTQLDSRSVGTTQVLIANLLLPGSPGAFVSGTTGNGELRVRVRCTRAGLTLFASGNLMQVAYAG
jgi:subtilisin family serine protease